MFDDFTTKWLIENEFNYTMLKKIEDAVQDYSQKEQAIALSRDILYMARRLFNSTLFKTDYKARGHMYIQVPSLTDADRVCFMYATSEELSVGIIDKEDDDLENIIKDFPNKEAKDYTILHEKSVRFANGKMTNVDTKYLHKFESVANLTYKRLANVRYNKENILESFTPQFPADFDVFKDYVANEKQMLEKVLSSVDEFRINGNAEIYSMIMALIGNGKMVNIKSDSDGTKGIRFFMDQTRAKTRDSLNHQVWALNQMYFDYYPFGDYSKIKLEYEYRRDEIDNSKLVKRSHAKTSIKYDTFNKLPECEFAKYKYDAISDVTETYIQKEGIEVKDGNVYLAKSIEECVDGKTNVQAHSQKLDCTESDNLVKELMLNSKTYRFAMIKYLVKGFKTITKITPSNTLIERTSTTPQPTQEEEMYK